MSRYFDFEVRVSGLCGREGERERGEGVSEWVGCERERERGGFKEDRVEKV